jgi:sensor histidine kinase YesM
VYNGFPLSALFVLNLYNLLLVAACYYLVINFIWRRLIKKKGYIIGVLALLMLLLTYALIDAMLEKLIIARCEECLLLLKRNQIGYYQLLNSDIINILIRRLITLGLPIGLLLTLGIPLSVKFALKFYRSHLKSLNLAKENLQLELSFLKSQLNPHFLFNTMNNIYGLIVMDNKEKSADLLSRLSGILRYILYDSDKETMPLTREIKLIQDYIELEKVRLNNVPVKFNVCIDKQTYQIVPLLLIPLVENAFKFCTDNTQSYINLNLKVIESILQFNIENTFDTRFSSTDTGGIGLTNLQKRLLISYPNVSDYEAKIIENIYSVKLTIQLI